jgi:hypothetical protein
MLLERFFLGFADFLSRMLVIVLMPCLMITGMSTITPKLYQKFKRLMSQSSLSLAS